MLEASVATEGSVIHENFQNSLSAYSLNCNGLGLHSNSVQVPPVAFYSQHAFLRHCPWRLPGICQTSGISRVLGWYHTHDRVSVAVSVRQGTETHRGNNGAAPSGAPCCILTHQKGHRR